MHNSSVIELFSKDGYSFAPFNNTEQEMDLSKVSSRNGLELSEDGHMLLSGKDHSLVFGPFLDLYSGQYEVTFDLELPASDVTAAADTLGNIRISSYWGENIAADVPLTPSMFDESGRLTLTIPFTGNGRGYEFLIFMQDDHQVSVRRIAYKRVG